MIANLLPRVKALDQSFNPKESYREGQLAAVMSCWGAIHNGYKYIALNAETGSGKSIIAATLANLTGSSYICTTRLKLQDQYLELGPDFKKTDGRGNHICIMSGRHKTCDNGVCISGPEDFVCNHKPSSKGLFEGFNDKKWSSEEISERCEYWRNVERGVNAKHTVFNYPYFMLKMNSPYNDFNKRPLLVLDEGHNIEDYVRGIATIEIHDRSLNVIQYDRSVDSDDFPGFDRIPVENLKGPGAIYDWLTSLKQIVDIRYSETVMTINAGVKGLRKRRSGIESLQERIDRFTHSYETKPENWVSTTDDTGFKLVPLYIGDYFHRYMSVGSEVILMMSATLPTKKTLCKRLGISEDELFYYNMDSTFPPENAPIYSHAQPVMNYEQGQMESKRNKMGAKILAVMKEYKGKRGLLLCNSYEEMRHYIRFITSTDLVESMRLTVHERGIKAEYVLEEHAESEDSVFTTVSSWEGLDLPGDLAEFEIIAKVPYQDVSSPVVRGLKELDGKRYFEDACIKVRQGAGRVVRSPEDKADIHFLDGAFRRLFRFNNKEFPESFRERVILL